MCKKFFINNKILCFSSPQCHLCCICWNLFARFVWERYPNISTWNIFRRKTKNQTRKPKDLEIGKTCVPKLSVKIRDKQVNIFITWDVCCSVLQTTTSLSIFSVYYNATCYWCYSCSLLFWVDSSQHNSVILRIQKPYMNYFFVSPRKEMQTFTFC